MDDTAGAVTFRGKSPWPLRRVGGLLGGVAFLTVAFGAMPTRFAPPAMWDAMMDAWRTADGAGGVFGALLMSILIVAWVLVWGLLLLGGVAVLALNVWNSVHLRRTRVRLSDSGCEVAHGRRRVEIPWDDVAHWEFAASRLNGSPEEGVVAVPAGHVAEPDAPPRRAVWSRESRHWVLCVPDWTHATREEVQQAMRRFAGRLEGA